MIIELPVRITVIHDPWGIIPDDAIDLVEFQLEAWLCLIGLDVLCPNFIENRYLNSGFFTFLLIHQLFDFFVFIAQECHVSRGRGATGIVHLDLAQLLFPVAHLVLAVVVLYNALETLSLIRFYDDVAELFLGLYSVTLIYVGDVHFNLQVNIQGVFGRLEEAEFAWDFQG